MNIIFLDIDGVMNHLNYLVRSNKHYSYEFCPRSVENLKKIIKKVMQKSLFLQLGDWARQLNL